MAQVIVKSNYRMITKYDVPFSCYVHYCELLISHWKTRSMRLLSMLQVEIIRKDKPYGDCKDIQSFKEQNGAAYTRQVITQFLSRIKNTIMKIMWSFILNYIHTFVNLIGIVMGRVWQIMGWRPSRVKPKTMKLVYIISPLDTLH